MNSSIAEKTLLPGDAEIAVAAESSRKIAAFLNTKFESQLIELIGENDARETVRLPAFALRLLNEMLTELAHGNAVKIVPIHAELTTQEAADLLNVSRPHFVKLLDQGVLPHTMTGRHRRVKFADVVAYRERRDAESSSALDELAAEAQELKMGY